MSAHRQNFRPEPLRSDNRRRRALLSLALICAVIALWALIVVFVEPARAAIDHAAARDCRPAASSLPILGLVSR